MSLINDMLRDLERRRPARDGAVLEGVQGVAARPARRALPLGGIALAVLAVGVGYWAVSGALIGASAKPSEAVLPLEPVVAVIEPLAPAVEVVPVEVQPQVPAARWVGLDTESRPDRLQLGLRFSALPDPMPELVVNEGQGHLSLTGIDLSHAPALPVTGADAPLRSLGIRSDEQARLDFRLAPGARVSLESLDDGRRLVLVFENPVTVAQADTQTVASPAPVAPPPPRPQVKPEPVPEAAPESAPKARAQPAEPAPVVRRSHGDHYNQALAALRSGDTDVAERGLRHALTEREDMHDARQALATLLAGDGRSHEAMSLLARGLELAPNHVGLRRLLAHLRVEQGDLNGAVEVLRAGPADPALLAMLGALYQRQGNAEQAAGAYRQALQTDPSVGVWWAGLAIALESAGQPASAPEAYRRALRFGGLDARLDDYARERLAALENVP
jgi:MSHA biogenesis protein MshN